MGQALGCILVKESTVVVKEHFGKFDEVLEPALDEIVQDSKNPFDNMAKAALYQPLEDVIKKKIDEAVDKLIASM